MTDFKRTGSFRIYQDYKLVLVIAVAILFAFFASKNILAFSVIVGVFFCLYFINRLVKNPSVGMNIVLISSFLIAGFSRIVPLPFGLTVDVMVALLWLILFFKGFDEANWKIKNNLLTYSLGIWALFCFFQLFNPLASSTLAWFYAVRGLAFNSVLIVPLVFLLYNQKKNYNQFVHVWFAFSTLLGLYGAKQYLIGVFSFEQAWLDAGGHVTHVLWGRFTRMFSFLSDANQFGCSQAHVGTVAFILASSVKKNLLKATYLIVGLICFYGMFISGTRGAIVIPIISFGVYLFLSKNFKVILGGSIMGSVVLYLLVFTHVGHGIEPVRRMRTAFNATEDASFLVRIENRERLDRYLSDKPFGGGIGSAGVWGQRFSPSHFLAHFETDGHYVRIKAETGPIGLYLYVILHIIIIGKMLLICWNLKNKELKSGMGALTAGIIGLMAANYSAAVTIGLPTSTLVYCSMAFVFMSPFWDKGFRYPFFGEKNSNGELKSFTKEIGEDEN